jgi:uncharacterized SAM-binding protein YcdF (DUF218 family)
MFFILSKTLNYLTMPLVIIVICLVLSVIVRKTAWKKWLFGIGLGLLLFCTNDFIANEVIHWWELPATPFSQIKKTYEWGIILTGITRLEAEPRDRVHFARGADRATHSVQLYKLGIIKKILVSGGSGRLDGEGPREADELATALVMMGVRPEDLLLENESRNTHESAEFVKKMLQDKSSPNDCLLITSAYHMRRSVACFIKAQWSIDYFSVDILSHKRKYSFENLLIPKPEALGIWHTLVKEWAGMLAYRLAGYI